MLYPVILAGGSGTRLWPVSTKSNPKQVNYFLDNKTLLQVTWQRLSSGFDKSDIFMITSKDLAPIIKRQIKIIPNNIFVEPQARNTAAAIGLAAVNLLAKDKEAVIVTINSDAHVKEVKQYLKVIKQAGKLAASQPDKLVLLGIKPQYPETCYGYIQRAAKAQQTIGGYQVFAVKDFKEKPNLITAKKYLARGNYLWNPAIFVFSAQSLLNWYQKYLPGVYRSLEKISQALKISAKEYQKVLTREYKKIESISIDYGLLEKLDNMMVIPANLTWLDIGHWRSLRDAQLKNKRANVIRGKHIGIDSARNLLYADNKLIVTIGVDDMILVATDKVIFLCPADRSHEVKDLLKKLTEEGLEEYL